MEIIMKLSRKQVRKLILEVLNEDAEVVPGFEDPKYDRFSVKDKKEIAEFMKDLPFGEPTSMASLEKAQREANLAAAKKKLEAIRKRVEDEKIVDEFMKGLDFGEPSDMPGLDLKDNLDGIINQSSGAVRPIKEHSEERLSRGALYRRRYHGRY
tara:strand:+ start:287 stop:748 length:462 start_codon:yes stop_codon:yes gene_type:complete